VASPINDIDSATVIRYAQAYQQRETNLGAVSHLVADGHRQAIALAKIAEMVEEGLLQCADSRRFPWPTFKGLKLLDAETPRE
jgi:hypothetical protein